MVIISDTSPITNLIKIGKLYILELLFTEIIIPVKVYEELANYENQKEIISQCAWIKVKKVQQTDLVQQLANFLDDGEAEAIALANELNARFLIIDERKGRQYAEKYGLKIIGLLGILIRAKQKGHIDFLKPILTELENDIGFRMSKSLLERVLREAGET